MNDNEITVKRIESGKYVLFHNGNIIGKVERNEYGEWIGNLNFIENSVSAFTKAEAVNWLVGKYKLIK